MNKQTRIQLAAEPELTEQMKQQLIEAGWTPPVEGFNYEPWRRALTVFYQVVNTGGAPMLPAYPAMDSIDRQKIDAIVAALRFAPLPWRTRAE